MESVYPNVNEVSINRCVAYYLMSSYLYYKKDKHVLSDTDFDIICKRLVDEWDTCDHIHKKFLDKGALKAGTGHTNEYNNRIIGGAEYWYNAYEKEIKNVL